MAPLVTDIDFPFDRVIKFTLHVHDVNPPIIDSIRVSRLKGRFHICKPYLNGIDCEAITYLSHGMGYYATTEVLLT